LNVLNHRELEARYEIRMEIFKKVIQIESRVLGDLAINHIIPTAIRYQNTLIENVRGMRELLDTGEFNRQAGLQLDTLKRISGHISSVHELVTQMTEERKIANAMENTVEQSFAYSSKVKPFLEEIRSHIDVSF